MKSFCLITGAASGIGLELAKIFIAHSFNLVLIDINVEKLEEIKQEFETNYDCVVHLIHKDLSQPKIADEIYAKLKELNVSIEVLVNNAGYGIFGFFQETTWEKQLDLIQLSVVTTTHLTKLLLNDMLLQNSGKILNVSSIAAFQPGPLMAIYYSAKAFLLSFSQAIANELKGTNVTVTVLCPGMTRTNFQKSTGNQHAKLGLLCASPEKVAIYGYHAMQKGKAVAIPCYYNRVIANIHRFLTLNQATNLSRYLQERNRGKR